MIKGDYMFSKKRKKVTTHDLKIKINQLEIEKSLLNKALLDEKACIEQSKQIYQTMLVQLENAINDANIYKRNAENFKNEYLQTLNEIKKLKEYYQNTVKTSIKDIQRKLGDYR